MMSKNLQKFSLQKPKETGKILRIHNFKSLKINKSFAEI